ncbi:MAG: PilZ domain-containing protein [Clostridiales bacterium]|nr:PilZ domain-containing protein [Clostridiales bacterium]
MRRKREETWLAKERRKESRVKEEDKVVIEILEDGKVSSEKRIINALTKDISPGGVRVMTNLALPRETPVRIEIALARRRKLIKALGLVRWSRSVYEEELFEMGVEFTQISTEDKVILLEHTYKKR